MLSSRSSGLCISGSPAKKKRTDEDNTPKKRLNKTLIQQTVGSGDAIKLLMVVFWQSRRGFWWTMFPKDEHLGDITAATGISFDLLLPLFLRTKIIKATVTSVVNQYTVSLTMLMELAHSVTAMGMFKMKVTRCKYIGQVLFDYYFCLNKPLYDTPGIPRQTSSISMWKNSCLVVASMLMSIPRMININILKEVKKIALNLLAHGLAVRILWDNNTAFLQRELMDTEQ